MENDDALQRYCLYVDSANFDAISAMWDAIHRESNKGLEAAIDYLHSIVDTNEDFTPQLLTLRNRQ